MMWRLLSDYGGGDQVDDHFELNIITAVEFCVAKWFPEDDLTERFAIIVM